jgi:hypothetical protein
MRGHFEMCYMVTKFVKRMLRAKERPIRIERVIRNTGISYEENPVKRRKYLIRVSDYVI